MQNVSVFTRRSQSTLTNKWVLDNQTNNDSLPNKVVCLNFGDSGDDRLVLMVPTDLIWPKFQYGLEVFVLVLSRSREALKPSPINWYAGQMKLQLSGV